MDELSAQSTAARSDTTSTDQLSRPGQGYDGTRPESDSIRRKKLNPDAKTERRGRSSSAR
jgi:hypothetical protein